MCSGDITQLSCGHTLQHLTPCPRAPRPCAVAWERRALRDTCAACDPAIRRRRLGAEYEARHAALTARMLEARRAGDERAVGVLGGAAGGLVAWHREGMREVLELERKVGPEVSLE